MDKNDFFAELKELLPDMSKDEITKTLETLNGCKPIINKKDVLKKAYKSRIFSSTDANETELTFLDGGKNERKAVALGASLLMSSEFECFKNDIPDNYPWWLYDFYYVENSSLEYTFKSGFIARIRPIIIVKEMPDDMKTGDRVIINGEDFVFLAPLILLKLKCLDGLCTYSARGYASSVIKFCVDGWYADLVRKNKKQSAAK